MRLNCCWSHWHTRAKQLCKAAWPWVPRWPSGRRWKASARCPPRHNTGGATDPTGSPTHAARTTAHRGQMRQTQGDWAPSRAFEHVLRGGRRTKSATDHGRRTKSATAHRQWKFSRSDHLFCIAGDPGPPPDGVLADISTPSGSAPSLTYQLDGLRPSRERAGIAFPRSPRGSGSRPPGQRGSRRGIRQKIH